MNRGMMGGEFGFDAYPDIELPFASECVLTWRIAGFRGLSRVGVVECYKRHQEGPQSTHFRFGYPYRNTFDCAASMGLLWLPIVRLLGLGDLDMFRPWSERFQG